MGWRTIVVALAVVLAGCPSANTGGPTPTVTDTATSTPTATPTATPTPTPVPTAALQSRNYTVDESFVVGTGDDRLRYTVTNVTETDRVGGEFGPAADRQFVVVNLTVTSVEGYVRLTSDAFALVTANGTHPPDESAMLFVDEALTLRNVASGATLRGVVVFDVSPDGGTQRLRITPANATAGQSQYVVLD
ncbi:DUF4352 domain-containing protein [Haloplanus natans]|uniref:DUF4352 domain-containing protein n=1 Tax=Haloplanus natans TaxID=376171 RepID=UPI000677EB50|nr:DUF4352 domain-containing protein [Haloplanus natans]